MRAKLLIAVGALVAIGWAVPNEGTAHFLAPVPQNVSRTANRVRLRVEKHRGLLVNGWINGHGPYVFAVDTGAGMNLITPRTVTTAKLQVRITEPTRIGGLTSATSTTNREAIINELALGDRSNVFRAKTVLVVPTLAPGIDGVLDPTDIYSPNGYSIDLPNERLETVVSSSGSVERPASGGEGAVVPWVRVGGSIRPFVRLGDGRLALIDTGSGFGLAVNERNATVVGAPRRSNQTGAGSRDIGGGTINSRRVAPTTISIGDLVLRRIPTDILYGVTDDAPLILGRDALYPFKITFDPERRLIKFVTSQRT